MLLYVTLSGTPSRGITKFKPTNKPLCNTNLVYFFLELIDYPESDEDTGTESEELATGNFILDSEDMDMGTGIVPHGAASSIEESNRSASLLKLRSVRVDPPPRAAAYSEGTNRKRSGNSTISEKISEDGPDLPPIYLTVRKEKEKKWLPTTFLVVATRVQGAPCMAPLFLRARSLAVLPMLVIGDTITPRTDLT